jgi:hypothetical protein
MIIFVLRLRIRFCPPITQIAPIRLRISQHQDTKNTKKTESRRQAPIGIESTDYADFTDSPDP